MRVLALIALIVPLAFTAAAADGVVESSIHARSLASAAAGAIPARPANAPFKRAHDPMPEMLLRDELERRGPRGSCEASASDLCYDLRDGRVVYRPVRRYMPTIEGLRPESISLRRDRIVFKYSFR
jgi:hypothetical protein